MGNVESNVQNFAQGMVQQVSHMVPMPLIESNLEQQIQQAKTEQERLQAAYDKLKEELDKKDSMDSEIDLDNQEHVSTEMLHKLAQKVAPVNLSGRNIGLFGVTSAGKSSTVNALLGSKMAGTGVGEATKEITAYDGINCRLYDFPGQNDDLSYFNKECIALMKGLTHRLVLITATVKEVKNLLDLFEAIDIQYDIIINKFDEIDFEERITFQEQINQEIKEYQLKNIDHVWCVSAKHPEQFPYWLQMVNYLTQ